MNAADRTARAPYFDRQGNPISAEAAVPLWPIDERRVAETKLPNGRWVSTVHLVINHGPDEAGRPLIFETMVFPAACDDVEELACWRYATEDEARAGHLELVRRWSEGTDGA